VKRAVLLLGFVALLAAGCGPAVAHVDGAAGPVTASSPPGAASPSASPPRPPSPSVSGTKGGQQASTVLGPDGFGALKLGMTQEQATATGLVGRWPVGTGCELNTFLKSAPADGDAGRVYMHDKRGVQKLIL
jgi:hypothetical protein